MKFLDLSGYMFSGKSAVSDLLREHAGFHVPSYRSEFDLIRMPGGLGDLKKAVVDDWSWVRSDKALRNFLALVETLDRTPHSLWDKLFRPGFSYGKRFDGFLEKSRRFAGNITSAHWRMAWPYELTALNPLQYALLRITSKLRRRQAWPEIDYRLVGGEDFLAHARAYLEELLVSTGGADACHTVVTHNMLEPYNPEAGFCFFDDIRSIVVDRDVRDIYMTATSHSEGFNDEVGLYSRILGAFDIDLFIARQKILRAKTQYQPHHGILRLGFERIVDAYADACDELRDFLGIPASAHIEPMRYFDPEKSRRNVGLWKSAQGEQLKAIGRIEAELPDLCLR